MVPTYLPAVRYGGPIFAVHSLCRALVSRGHHVEVVTTNINGFGTSDVPIGMRVNIDDVQVRYFSSKVLSRLSWAPALAKAVENDVDSFDIVHLQTVFLWPTWAAARVARNACVPYLVSPRGMLVKGLIERRNQLIKSAWINLIERSNLERASAIHTTSEVEADELARFNWHLPRVTTISNGVDAPDRIAEGAIVSSDVINIANGKPLALFFGRLSWKKGLDRLLQAFARTNTGNLAIVGTDDERLVFGLSKLAHMLRITDRVRILPRTITGHDKEYLFSNAQLFVLPSYSENFGNTVLEAMRRGVPVVLTPEVGAAEIVRKAGGGIVTDGTPVTYGEAMEQLLHDSVLARSMGKAGRRYVMERYTWDRIAARMEELYESVKGEVRRN